MNYLDLFHGIGGFALGAYWAGMKFDHHYCSDIEPWCQKLYAKRFPDSIQLGDITKINAEKLPAGDWIITGGFPCQDISIAGKGAGIHGERSGLWFEYWRLIRYLRPRFAIMENVGMLVHRGLREVLGSLAEIGYNAEWQDIRASDVGAPHRRERIWIVAYAERERSGTGTRISAQRKQGLPDIDGCGRSSSNERRSDVSDATSAGREAVRDATELVTKNVNQCCFGNWWSTEPDVGRVAHGIPARVDRLRGLGNAIVPQIAELLFRQIKPDAPRPSSR